MKKLIVASLFILLTSCAATPTAAPTPALENKQEAAKYEEIKSEVAKEEIKKVKPAKGKLNSCICIKLWMPVCGEDNKTYANVCEANCAGVKYAGGECQKKK